MLDDWDNFFSGIAPTPKSPKPKSASGDSSVASVVDDELGKLGWSPNARLSLLGDLGRENGWNRDIIFGGHNDPKNNAANLGIISWQGDRRNKMLDYLKQNGAYDGRAVKKDDNSLRLMTQFMDSEMKNSSEWQNAHSAVRQPDISTADASEHLRKYIKYDPRAPYNSPDKDFGVANNAKWANKAKALGLAAPNDYDNFFGELKSGKPAAAVSPSSAPGNPDYDNFFNELGAQSPLAGVKPPMQTGMATTSTYQPAPVQTGTATTETYQPPQFDPNNPTPISHNASQPAAAVGDPRLTPNPLAAQELEYAQKISTAPDYLASPFARIKTKDGKTFVEASNQDGLKTGETRFLGSGGKESVWNAKTTKDGQTSYSPIIPQTFGNQTVKPMRPRAKLPLVNETLEQTLARIEKETQQQQQQPTTAQTSAGTSVAPAEQSGALPNINNNEAKGLGSAVQVDLTHAKGLKGDALKEYVFRRGLEQIAAHYSLTPAEVDAFVEEGRKGGFFDDAQFNKDLKAAHAKDGDLKSHVVIPAWQINEILKSRKVNEKIATEEAARRSVNEQTVAHANSLTGQIGEAASKGLQKGFEYLNPLNAIRDISAGEFNRPDTPEEIAARQQSEIYGNSSTLDGRATDYLKNQEEARNMSGIEYGANIASSAAQVPADLFANTVLTPAAIAQTAAERLAGRNTTVGDTFLGQAAQAIKKTYAENFKVHAGVQNDFAVAGVRKLGNLAGTVAIGLLPGGQALTAGAFGGQTATSFYEDAKNHGATEDVRLVAAGVGAVLGTAQGTVFSKMFGALSNEAKESFIKEFADSMRSAAGKENVYGLVKAAQSAAEQSAPTALGSIAKNSAEGGAAMGGLTLAQNLTAGQLYDPTRKATTGVGESMLEGGIIGGGLGALFNGRQAANEIRESLPVKRAVEAVSEIYKQTQIRPNILNLQDKLADIYERADSVNVSLSADKIISQLQPELSKLPRKVRNEMVEAIKAGDAEAELNSAPTLRLPEKIQSNEQPVTETPQTLAKQTAAVVDPESAKVAVLYTDPNTAPVFPEKGTWRIKLADDSVLSVSKEKVRDYGINSFEDLQTALAQNQEETVSALLGKPSNSHSPENPAAVSVDAAGNELSATNVSTPAEADAAHAKDLADFPGQVAGQQIVPTAHVLDHRNQGSQIDEETILPNQTQIAENQVPPSQQALSSPEAAEATPADQNQVEPSGASLPGSVAPGDVNAPANSDNAPSALRQFYHQDFGLVTETENQKGVIAGRVRVIDQSGKSHQIKTVKGTGAGNQKAVAVGLGVERKQDGAQSPSPRTTYVENIREKRNVAEREANTDALTGLANKNAFQKARTAAEQNPSKHFISLDLNGFKAVNDELGHSAGDTELVRAGSAFRQAAKEIGVEMLAARPGGDEFAGIVSGTREQAEAVKTRAEELFGANKVGKTTLSITGKVGATFDEADSGLTELKTKRKIELAKANGEIAVDRNGNPLEISPAAVGSKSAQSDQPAEPTRPKQKGKKPAANSSTNDDQKTLTAAYGKETADYIATLLNSKDAEITRVARELQDAAPFATAKGETVKKVVEIAANALDLFVSARTQKMSVAEVRAQGRIDEQEFTPAAVTFAGAMEGGDFAAKFRSQISRVAVAPPQTLAQETGNDSLKRARTAERQREADSFEGAGIMSDIVPALGELKVDGHRLEINAAGAELIRRAIEHTNLEKDARNFTPESMLDGLFLEPAQVRQITNAIKRTYLNAIKPETGWTARDAKPLLDFAHNLQEAAKNGKGSAIVHLFDDALPEEEGHFASFEGAMDKHLPTRWGGRDLYEADFGKELGRMDDWFEHNGYAGSSDAARLEETFVKLLTGQREKLTGADNSSIFSEKAAVDFLDKALDYYTNKHDAELKSFIPSRFIKEEMRVSDLIDRARERAKNRNENANQNLERSGVRPQDDNAAASNRGDARASGSDNERSPNSLEAQGQPGSEESGVSGNDARTGSNEQGENGGIASAETNQQKERGTIKTAAARGLVEKESLDGGARYYKVKSRDLAQKAAQDEIERIGLSRAIERALTMSGEVSAENTAFRMEVVNLLHTQAMESDNPLAAKAKARDAAQILGNIAQNATDYGQAISQLAKWSLFDAETTVSFVEKQRAQRQIKETLPPEQAKDLKESAEDLGKAEKRIKTLENKIQSLRRQLEDRPAPSRISKSADKARAELAAKKAEILKALFGDNPPLSAKRRNEILYVNKKKSQLLFPTVGIAFAEIGKSSDPSSKILTEDDFVNPPLKAVRANAPKVKATDEQLDGLAEYGKLLIETATAKGQNEVSNKLKTDFNLDDNSAVRAATRAYKLRAAELEAIKQTKKAAREQLPDAQKELLALKDQRNKDHVRFMAKVRRAVSPTPTWIARFNRAYQGSVVANLGTQVTNAVMSLPTFSFEGATDALETALLQARRKAGFTVPEDQLPAGMRVRDAILPLYYSIAGSKQLAANLLSDYPAQYEELFRSYNADLPPTSDEATDMAQYLFDGVDKFYSTIAKAMGAELQEFHFRRAALAGEMVRQARARGIKIEDLESGTAKLPEAVVNAAVQKALRLTYAQSMRNMLGQNKLAMGMESIASVMQNYVPAPINPVLFPRFMAASTKFVFDTHTLGITDAIAKGKYDARSLSKGLLGLSLILGAVALARYGDDDDDPATIHIPGAGQWTVGKYNPFSAFLYTGVAINRMIDGKPPIKDGSKAFEAYLGIRDRTPGTELLGTLFGLMTGKNDSNDVGKQLETVSGRTAGGFIRFLSPIKDLAAQFIDSENVQPDMTNQPFLGEIRRALPFDQTLLGKGELKINAVTGTPEKKKLPALGALGVRIQSDDYTRPKQTAAEELADRMRRAAFGEDDRSDADKQKGSVKAQLREAMRVGKDTAEGEKRAIEENILTKAEIADIRSDAKVSPLAEDLKPLSLEQIAKVWAAMTFGEKQSSRQLIIKKSQNQQKSGNLDAGDKAALAKMGLPSPSVIMKPKSAPKPPKAPTT